MKLIIKASLIAAAIYFLPHGVQAAGLGQITVQSNLGEPLSAEIQLNATQQELQSLSARVAPPDVFLQANVPYAGFVPNVRVTVENRGDRSVLKLTSATPVNEAVASLIIQLNWDEGRLSRTYNFLLDPADLVIRPAAPVEPTVVAQPAPPPFPVDPPPARPPVEVAAQPPAPAPIPMPAPPPPPEPAQDLVLDLGDEPVIVYRETQPVQEVEPVAPPPPPREAPPPAPVERYVSPTPVYPEIAEGEHTVRYGETLGSIASRRVPGDVTLEQMMMALYRANPTAFVGNNINRLRTGAVLRMPSADDVRSTSHVEARSEVRMHARDFNLWRSQLAAEVASRPATPAEDVAGGTRAIDTIPPVAEQDRDRVVIASADTGAQGGTSARMRELEENIASTQNSLREASARVEELEAINRRLESLLALKNQEVARLEQRTPPPPTPAPEPTPAPAPELPPPAPPEPAPEIAVAPPAPELALPEPEVFIEPEIVPGETAQETFVEAPLQDPVAYPPTYEDPLWEALTDPQVLGVGALVIALLGGFLGFRSWQRKRSDIGLDTLSQDGTSVFPGEATSIFGSNGGQSVDTTANSVIHTDFSQTGLSIDTNEGVDPVAEADVYMAYGRDSQAEEILNDALKADPKRGAIYVKLLEIHAQRQDLQQFEATASELFTRTQGQGRDWEKAAQMGRRLDPSNPLYSGKSPGQEGYEASNLPGLEPADQTEHTRMGLDMGVPTSPVGSGPTLSDLDFGATPSTVVPTDAGHLKETVVVRGRIGSEAADSDPDTQMPMHSRAAAPGSTVDFQFEPAESVNPKVPGSIDFDLGRTQATNEMGKQPISVTVSRPRQPTADLAGVTSRRAGSRTAGNDLAGPLDFGLPAQDKGVGDMSATVVLPSARGGNDRADDVTIDLEKTGFDPNALDFDLDLDLKPAKKGGKGGRQSTLPPANLDPVDAGEIDTRLELARAYGDMGDTEGALELLREVAAEGNAAQRAEAQALIAKLG